MLKEGSRAVEAPSWKRWGVPLALISASFIYGCWAIFGKAVLNQHGEHRVLPLILATYRCVGGGMVMLIMHRCIQIAVSKQVGDSAQDGDKRIAAEETTRGDVLRFILLGVLMAVNIGGNVLALENLPALTVSVFQPALPVVAGVVSVLLGVEELSLQKACGLFFAAGGAVVVIIFGAHSNHNTSGVSYVIGLPCLCLNVCGGALYTVFQKGLLKKYPPVLTAAMGFMEGGVILTIVTLATYGVDAGPWRMGESGMAVLALLYSIFLTTAYNYSVCAWANRETTPATVMSFMTLQPVAAAVLSWIIYRVVLTMAQALGGIAIIVGLMLFIWRPSDPSSQPLLAAKGTETDKRV